MEDSEARYCLAKYLLKVLATKNNCKKKKPPFTSNSVPSKLVIGKKKQNVI